MHNCILLSATVDKQHNKKADIKTYLCGTPCVQNLNPTSIIKSIVTYNLISEIYIILTLNLHLLFYIWKHNGCF